MEKKGAVIMRSFIAWVKGILWMFFHGEKNILKNDVAISEDMRNAIELWTKMVKNEAPWLDSNTKSLDLTAAIASEFARLVMTEFHSEITGGKRAEFLQEAYEFLLRNLQEQTEYACALGGLVFRPYVDGGRIVIDYTTPDKFIPTAYNSRREITGAVFIERQKKGSAWYTKMERHELTDVGYIVQNKAFISYQESELGVPVNLTGVEEWASLEPEINLHYVDGSTLERPLFVYFRMPFANHIDPASPLGVSAVARAEGLIEQADKQYSRILWEYEGSELAVDASVGALKQDGKKLPVRKQRLFRELNLDRGASGELYEVFNPEIRDSSLFNGLNQLLRRIEFNCHLSYGTLSDPQNQEKTAEEIRMSKQRSYAAVCNIQKSLESSLEHLVWIMDYYTSLYDLAPDGAYETVFTWGDGVLTDTGVDFAQRKAMVDSGILKPEEFLSWYFGVSVEEAKEMLPTAQDAIGFGE